MISRIRPSLLRKAPSPPATWLRMALLKKPDLRSYWMERSRAGM